VVLRRPPTTWDELEALAPSLIGRAAREPSAVEAVTIQAKYHGYIQRQAREVERFRRLEHHALPDRLDYQAIPHLRVEAREKLERVRPRSLGQAGRISGVHPADLATLLVFLKREEPAPSPSRPPNA
jgi:tRNA uridine 5-carboxymethylaminomethyl modification enzyme